MSTSLAVKHRPHIFKDVVEQKTIIDILMRQIETGQIKHGYLFCGQSGSGKTTTARIFASTINGSYDGIDEIDAASNNGVENVRALIATANQRSLSAKYRIIILDECHVFTQQAWQAFLKGIEEPSPYTIYIFCTTEPQKIPETVLNRLQRFNFTKISTDGIINRLKYICNAEGFTYDDTALDYIAKNSNGAMREAISLLEKVSGLSNNISIENTLQALGDFSFTTFFTLLNNLIDGNEAGVLEEINVQYNQGRDLQLFVEQFFSFVMDVLKYSLFKNYNLIKIPKYYETQLENSINFNDTNRYYSYVVDKLLELKNMIKTDVNAKTTIEVLFLQIARCR